MGIKANEIGRKSIQAINGVVNLIVLVNIILLTAFAGYALWDSNQIHHAADKSHYAIYKPTAEDDSKSFKELQSLNPEIIAWLSIYGTNIDYPVTQGKDNMKYVNTNAEGQYSLSGAIFLDYKNNKNFKDFNSILYGHHMQKKTMFGEIGNFSDKKIFDARRYGNLYFDEKNYGIEFFAYIHTSAYDYEIFKPNVNEGERQTYLDNLLTDAIHKRDIGVTTEDHIILFSTCSSTSTNGRDILIGRITEEVYDDPFENQLSLNTEINDEKEQDTNNQDGFVKEIYMLNFIFAISLIILISVIYYRQKRKRRSKNI